MRDKVRIGIVLGMVAALAVGCGYYHYMGPLKPADESKQPTGASVSDDGTVTFTQDRLEVALRPMMDEELNRQFAANSKAGAQSTNPYTFGDSKYWDLQMTPQRFTVFKLKVKNYQYPKVLLDPRFVTVEAGNGREYNALGARELTLYYRAYATGYSGNAYDRFEQRKDILQRTLFPGDVLFSGQEQEGYIVFPPLHPDVDQITVWIRDLVVRFNYADEPVETLDVTFEFWRDVGRRYADGTIKLKK